MFCTATGHVNGTCEEEEVTYFLNQILNIQVGYIYFIDLFRVESFNSLTGCLSQDIIGGLHVAIALMEHLIE